MSAPDRIWLQDAGDYDHAAQFEVTWCAEPQDDADTEYIRADLVQALVDALRYYGEGTGDIGEYARDTLRAIEGDKP